MFVRFYQTLRSMASLKRHFQKFLMDFPIFMGDAKLMPAKILKVSRLYLSSFLSHREKPGEYGAASGGGAASAPSPPPPRDAFDDPWSHITEFDSERCELWTARPRVHVVCIVRGYGVS